MKKLLLLSCITIFSTVGISYAQRLYVDPALSTSFPTTFDSGLVVNLRFHVVCDTFIQGEYINMNYRVTNSPFKTSSIFLGSYVLLNSGDSAIISVPNFRIEPYNAFFVGEDIVVIWPTGSGGIPLLGDSIVDTVHISHLSGIPPVTDAGNISVYPNPAGQVLYISYDESKTNVVQIKIHDILGKAVLTKNSAFKAFDINSLPNGFYLLEVITADKSSYVIPFTKSQ